jgi:signal transduction histidine kinase
VRGSADDLRQAILALLTNALEAQPEGGWVVVGGERQGDRVRVWVDDGGPGLAREVAERVFEPGFTTRPPARGMGLSVARATARRHGGDLRLEEPPDEDGSRFVLELPAGRGEEA